MSHVRAHVVVSGRVQGVSFRAHTRRTAVAHDVRGWVRNLPDGTVEAVFEGDRAEVERLIRWCSDGSPHAAVTDVAVAWQDPEHETVFEVRY